MICYLRFWCRHLNCVFRSFYKQEALTGVAKMKKSNWDFLDSGDDPVNTLPRTLSRDPSKSFNEFRRISNFLSNFQLIALQEYSSRSLSSPSFLFPLSFSDLSSSFNSSFPWPPRLRRRWKVEYWSYENYEKGWKPWELALATGTQPSAFNPNRKRTLVRLRICFCYYCFHHPVWTCRFSGNHLTHGTRHRLIAVMNLCHICVKHVILGNITMQLWKYCNAQLSGYSIYMHKPP